jgi:hypothetical protein
VNARRLASAIVSALILSSSISAKRPRSAEGVIAVKMENDPRHAMIAVGCRVNGAGRLYSCVIDSGATHTIISDRVLKANGPLIDVTTANGVIHMHQQEVSLKLADGLEVKSKVLVQENMTPQDVDILLGEDVLRQFRAVIFDYEKGQVEFHR